MTGEVRRIVFTGIFILMIIGGFFAIIYDYNYNRQKRRKAEFRGTYPSGYCITKAAEVENNMSTLFCPILKKKCIGKNCAMAIKLDHFTISAYEVLYLCGLVVASSSYSFGEPQYIDSELKERKNG